MDTTEQRAGFRLPWSDRRESPASEDNGSDPPTDAAAADMPPDDETTAPDTAADEAAADVADATVAPEAAAGTAPARRPSRFLAELTRAMHAAAEEGRVATLDQLRADGKAAVEEIQSRSADDATAIRRGADDDVARIREWSKAEIARIREETEQRIAARKSDLDRQLEGHAAVVEAEIENVQGQVTAFESEMDTFFERLINEEDPGRFAALAASLPEPPPFAPLTEAQRAEVVARATGVADDVDDAPASDMPASDVADGASVEPSAPDEAGEVGAADGSDADQPVGETTEAMGEIAVDDAQAGSAEPAAAEQDGVPEAEAETQAPGEMDAERDALADVSAEEAEGSAVADGSISARLAGLSAPAHQPAPDAVPQEGPVETSQVVVTGLTSVSSIAAFKRQLGRLEGVRSVAVSSGPSGEFVFAVSHAAGVQLADAVASLGGFAPQIGRVEPGIVELTAHDPEA